ncbi:formate hydrogenlyase transcriptional activator FlhA [Edwardsiella tarda]|uniref:formate hydrogenlyase transcriptional activator FlhA n=1 Tax=Edwardsiella tarda TaxID=636 RepID=UPI000D507016|nr:formate hydrogenlyase transcriptional activator FlhA [Edwardsiella tarda]UCQ11853.1 formate hydrogenlyase transcriptional activator FlhA [Edwardsiella tarda]
MNNKATCSLSRMEPVWQDLLHQATRSLLAQRNLPGLMRALHQLSFSVIRFDRVNILRLDPLHNRITLYRYDPQRDCVTQDSDVLLADGPGGRVWAEQRPVCCSGATFRHDFAALAALPQYAAIGAYCQMPLTTEQQRLGGLELIKEGADAFSEGELALAAPLAEVVAQIFERLLEREQFQQQEEQLRRERDHFRILVDVTNAVTSKLELDALAAEVSKEIHRFFGIDYIGLSLVEQHDDRLRSYITGYQEGQPVLREQKLLPLAGSLAQQVIRDKSMLLMDLSDSARLAPQDRQLAQMLNFGHRTICQLPLIFGNKVLGVLKLAQCQPGIFTPRNLKLLRQIAARIAIAVDNALAYGEISRLKDSLVHENRYLTECIRQEGDFGEIVGQSEAMRSVLEQVEMVAASDCSVLILGETGTGKELIAQAIHNLSLRNQKRMVKMNCAAIPSGLLESDLFGHEKGAFTGASAQRMGRFELANHGTLFLDEVGDIPLELQPKLLRVLQEREIERVGGSKVIPVDVRLIAATNRDLKQMVQDRQYRSDLYYRLNVFPIVIPPLRERPQDIPLLVKFFTRKIAKRMNRTIDSIPTETIHMLSQLPWPGNVRELENIIERAVILSRGPVLTLPMNELQYHLSPPLANRAPAGLETLPTLPAAAQADTALSERERILQVLRECNGIVAGPRGAAMRLGVKRTTLISRMQRLGISVHDLSV